jgi:hypothetical protein
VDRIFQAISLDVVRDACDGLGMGLSPSRRIEAVGQPSGKIHIRIDDGGARFAHPSSFDQRRGPK